MPIRGTPAQWSSDLGADRRSANETCNKNGRAARWASAGGDDQGRALSLREAVAWCGGTLAEASEVVWPYVGLGITGAEIHQRVDVLDGVEFGSSGGPVLML